MPEPRPAARGAAPPLIGLPDPVAFSESGGEGELPVPPAITREAVHVIDLHDHDPEDVYACTHARARHDPALVRIVRDTPDERRVLVLRPADAGIAEDEALDRREADTTEHQLLNQREADLSADHAKPASEKLLQD